LVLGKEIGEFFLEKCKDLRDRSEIAEVPEEQDVSMSPAPNRKPSMHSVKSEKKSEKKKIAVEEKIRSDPCESQFQGFQDTSIPVSIVQNITTDYEMNLQEKVLETGVIKKSDPKPQETLFHDAKSISPSQRPKVMLSASDLDHNQGIGSLVSQNEPTWGIQPKPIRYQSQDLRGPR
jgi:hypothetical protein